MIDDARYEIRGVTGDDRADLLELARFLDSVNLPNDAAAMEPIIRRSERGFSGTEGDPRRREHVFVLYDRQEKRAVGTSLIVGQLGRAEHLHHWTNTDLYRRARFNKSDRSHRSHHSRCPSLRSSSWLPPQWANSPFRGSKGNYSTCLCGGCTRCSQLADSISSVIANDRSEAYIKCSAAMDTGNDGTSCHNNYRPLIKQSL